MGAGITVATVVGGVYGPVAAATACFLIRMLGVLFGLDAPRPPRHDG